MVLYKMFIVCFCQEASQDVQDREFSCESPCDRSSDCDVQSQSRLFDHVECKPFPRNRSYFYMKNGILMWRDVKSNHNVTYDQLVVPQPLRNKMLMLAHDIQAAGHLGERKTKFRLMAHFWWPKCGKHIHEYVDL